jgi:magnesium transporter
MVVIRVVEGVAPGGGGANGAPNGALPAGREAAGGPRLRRAGLDELAALARRPDVRYWVDLDRPTPEELARVAAIFGFHPLAVEDCRAPSHEPKVEAYDGYVFLIVHAIDLESIGERVTTTDLECFFGERYLVTHHVRQHASLEHLGSRVDGEPALLASGIDRVLHELLDAVVDRYFPAVAAMDARADALEADLLGGAGPELVRRLLSLKGEVTHLKRVVAPELDVVRKFATRVTPLISPQAAFYFRDVADHLARIEAEIENLRDDLTALMQVHLSVASFRLNEAIRILTVFSAVFLPLTLVAGIYGMNFEFMPELDEPWGYPFALGLMAAVAVVVLAFFRRRGLM